MITGDRQAKRTTLHEVAHRAGVSVSTVSLVLAGKADRRRIKQDTITRVRLAAEDLNYAPNLLTRSLRRGRTHVLSFYSTFRNREQADVYMDALSSAVEKAGGEAGYDILVHCNFGRSPKEIYQFLNGGLADGLILFAPQASDPLLALLRKSALPVVILSGRDTAKMFPSVADDVQAGMRLVSDALLANGHKRIAVLTDGAGAARDSDVRVRLLRESLAERGIEIPEGWVIPAISRDMEFLGPLMAEPEPPTAIFCWHDRLAYSVLAACEALEIQIPQQLSIVGYDGLYWPSATRHQAASVRVDPSALARTSVQILDELIAGYQGPLREELVPVSFVSGTSLGPATCNGAINESSH